MQLFRIPFTFFLVALALTYTASAARKPSQFVCLASLVEDDASVEELRIALALEEVFYCRAAQISGIATIRTSYRPDYASADLPFSYYHGIVKDGDDEKIWKVPHFKDKESAANFAKKHDIDLLFFGNLSLQNGEFTIVIESTSEQGGKLTVTAGKEELCAAWLTLIGNLSDHTGIKLNDEQKVSIINPSQKPAYIDLVALGAIIQDGDVDGEYESTNFNSVTGIDVGEDPDVEDLELLLEKHLEFVKKCKLPEFFHKMSYYGISMDNQTRGYDFLTAIALHPGFSKSFYYLQYNDPSIMPYHILKENGYGTSALLKNLRTFELTPPFLEKMQKILEKKNIEDEYEALVWYFEQALVKDEDEYQSRASLMICLAWKNDEASYKRHAGLLREMYPKRAAQIFDLFIKPTLRDNEGLKKDREKWTNAYFGQNP